MNKILLAIICFYSFSAFSESYIYFQNNTSISLQVSGDQFGTHIMSAGEWNVSNGVNTPWQTQTELFWTNRNSGVHNGDDFYFNIHLVNGLDSIRLQIKLTGTFTSSDMWHSASGPGFNHPWYGDGNFHEESFLFAGKTMTLKYSTQFTGGFDDIYFALQEHDPFPLNSADLTDNNTINILAYNIYMLSPPISLTNQDERAAHIIDVCQNYDAVMISEAFDNGARDDYLIPTMATTFPYYTSVVDDSGNALEDGGVMIFSRWPIDFESSIVFQDCEGSDCLANKGVMYAQIDKLGIPYHLFATHTQAWTGQDEVFARLQQLRAVKDFMDAQNIPSNERVLLGGDLNVDKFANHFNEYDSLYTIVNSVEPTLLGYPNTYDGSINYYAAPGVEYLDYVLPILNYANPIVSTNEPLISRSIHDDLWGIYDLSDHHAVHGHFKYSPSTSFIESDQPNYVLYPNPVKGIVTFSETISTIFLYSSDGKLLSSFLNTKFIDLSTYSNGIYILKTETEGNIFSHKLIKQ